MKLSTLKTAFGEKAEDDDGAEVSDVEKAEGDDESEGNDAIETFLDGKQDMGTRIAAFRRAVKACY